MLQIPVDAHRAAARMGNILQRPEEYERIILLRSDENRNLAPFSTLARVSLAGWGTVACGALGLPMKTGRTQRKVLVPC